MTKVFLKSPLGSMALHFEGDAIISAEWITRSQTDLAPRVAVEAIEGAVSLRVEQVLRWFTDFFDHGEPFFSVDMNALNGTAFQKKVWKALLAIPRGETRSYADIARAIRSPRAMRAVGRACGRNPIPLLIPCHRVVGASGKLTGFSGGLWRKEWLLQFEQRGAQVKRGSQPFKRRAA